MIKSNNPHLAGGEKKVNIWLMMVNNNLVGGIPTNP